MLEQIKKDLKKLENPEKAKVLQRFFKTGRGEYGEGDVFWGISVPDQHRVARKYKGLLSLVDLANLLSSKIHEYRLTALLILVLQYQKSDQSGKEEIINFYLKNTRNINNWDLVDLSAPKILGPWLLEEDRSVLYKLARSKNLWEKRIAMMATLAFIRNNEFDDVLKIAEILLDDKHDLIHKAVGWMLREVGKRDQKVEEDFLKKYYQQMPRAMLRYAIERFDEKKRGFYLKR